MTKHKYKLCKNCLNCKRKKDVINCVEGYFDNKDERQVQTLIPEEFECYSYNEV